MASYATVFTNNLPSAGSQDMSSTGCGGNPRGQARVGSSSDRAADPSDEDASLEETTGKKRRLSTVQVRSLEQNFEQKKKVEPDRKFQLAQELGLEPRQVAVWFQNRRARWKTKQLQRDYDLLQLDYNTLSSDCRALRQENERLLAQLDGLKQTLQTKECGEDENSAGVQQIIATSLQNVADGDQPMIRCAEDGILEMDHPLGGVPVLGQNNGSSSSLSPVCSRSVPVSRALVLLAGCATSDTDSSGTLNEESPHPINDSLGFQFGQPSSSMKYSSSDFTDINGEKPCLITSDVYQPFFRTDHTFETCNSFVNSLNDQPAAAVPLWEWAPVHAEPK